MSGTYELLPAETNACLTLDQTFVNVSIWISVPRIISPTIDDNRLHTALKLIRVCMVVSGV